MLVSMFLLLFFSSSIDVASSDPYRRYALITDVPRGALRSGGSQHGINNHTTPVDWLLHHHRCLCISSQSAPIALDHYSFVHSASPQKLQPSTELVHATKLLDLIHTKEGIFFTDIFTIFPNMKADSLITAIEEWSTVSRQIATGGTVNGPASMVISPQLSLLNPTIFIRSTYKGIRFVSLWKNWLSHCLESYSSIFPRCPKPLRFSLILAILQSRLGANFDTEPDLQLRSSFASKDGGKSISNGNIRRQNEDYFNNVYTELGNCLRQIKQEIEQSQLQTANKNTTFVISHLLIPSTTSPYEPSTHIPTDAYPHSELLLTVDKGFTLLRSAPATTALQENISIIHISPLPSLRRHNHLRIEKNATFQRLQLSMAVMKKCLLNLPTTHSDTSNESHGYPELSSDSSEEICKIFNGTSSSPFPSSPLNGDVNNGKNGINSNTEGFVDFGDTITGLTDLDMEYIYSDDYTSKKDTFTDNKSLPMSKNESKVAGSSTEFDVGALIQPPKKINVTVEDIFRPKTTMEAIVYHYYDFINFLLWWLTIFLLVAISLVFLSLPLISFGNRISPQPPPSSASFSSSPVAYAYSGGRGESLTPLLAVSHEGNEFHREMYAAVEIAERHARSLSERTRAEVTREVKDPMR